MSTHRPSEASAIWGGPPGVRFRPRDHAPDRLIGPPDPNYPGDDGRPRADNTLQHDWIFKIKGGLDIVFRADPEVFVAGNLLWYPVEGSNRTRLAPDALVVFDRPKGYRSAYVQHRECGIPPQVVFEVLSPTNGRRVRQYKLKFYEKHGVNEYYEFDPYQIVLKGWLREREILRPIPEMSGWVSPKLGIRFEVAEDLTIFGPDGQPFLDHVELSRKRDAAKQAAIEAQRLQADAQRLRAERLAAQLRALGLDPEE